MSVPLGLRNQFTGQAEIIDAKPRTAKVCVECGRHHYCKPEYCDVCAYARKSERDRVSALAKARRDAERHVIAKAKKLGAILGVEFEEWETRLMAVARQISFNGRK